MPKLKTKSGLKKRFKITGSGKVVKKKCCARHKLEKKSKRKKLTLRKELILNKTDAKVIRRLIPYS